MGNSYLSGLLTLKDVLNQYARGGHRNPRQDLRVRAIVLAARRTDLLAFLTSLSDRQFVKKLRILGS